MFNKKIPIICYLIASLVGVNTLHAGLTVIADSSNFLDMKVPDPANPGQCKTVEFGEIVGRLAVDPTQQYMIIGFRKTYTGPTCCDQINFLNIVTKDPNPPGWKDKNGKKTQINQGEEYIDPLSGGNIQRGKDEANPKADRKPWYDGVTTNIKASQTGDFAAGEQKSMDLNNHKNGDLDWTSDPTLDMVFGDAPTLTDGLEFTTLLVCVKDQTVCSLGGISWGRTADGTNHIDAAFNANNYPTGLTQAKIQAAFNRSGFAGYTVSDNCCPCEKIPAPSAFFLTAMGVMGLRFKRRIK